jgi:hypothetical protein
MLRPAVWPRTCKHFIPLVFVGMLGGGRITDRAWRQNLAGCLPRGRDTGLKLGLNLLGDFLEISACGSTARRDRRLSPEALKSIRRQLGVTHRFARSRPRVCGSPTPGGGRSEMMHS